MFPALFSKTLNLYFLLTITICSTQSLEISSIRVLKPVPDPVSIYDALAAHGLPIGLLPKGVKNFTVYENGIFEAHLDQPCRSKLSNQFEYKRDVSGKLSYGRVGNLTGMESLELFVWVSVNGIRVDIPNSGRIHFDLEKGVHKELSVSLFETPTDCVAVSYPPELADRLGDKNVDRILQYRNIDTKADRNDVL